MNISPNIQQPLLDPEAQAQQMANMTPEQQQIQMQLMQQQIQLLQA